MKKILIEYLLYIYYHFIQNDDIDIVKKWAKPFTKSVLFIRYVYIWILAVVFCPILLIVMKVEKFSENLLKNR